MRVFLLGAGASKGYTGSKSGITPPLARDFFETFYNLDIAGDRNVLVGNIVSYVRDTRGVQPHEIVTWSEDVEAFLSEVQGELLNRPTDPRDKFRYTRTYDEMIFLFASVLNEIQNGSVCESYSKLAALSTEDDSLVTFNWDTLLDRALAEKSTWTTDEGYGLAFSGIYRDGWELARSGGTARRLWKLHGSTNWLMPYYTYHFEADQWAFSNSTIRESDRPIFCFEKSLSEYETYGGRSRAGYEPFSYYYYPPNLPIDAHVNAPGFSQLRMGLPSGSATVNPENKEAMPLLVPPVLSKDYELLGNVLEPVWSGAEASLVACDELHIVGYSFPVTDKRAVKLLQDACSKRSDKLKVIVANPFPADIQPRLEAALGDRVAVEVRTEVFNEYLAWLERVS
ncbi:MAG: hypothetical protein WD716_11305 [Fimbriimonadaceae bacterium]